MKSFVGGALPTASAVNVQVRASFVFITNAELRATLRKPRLISSMRARDA